MQRHIIVPAFVIALGVSSVALAQADAGNVPPDPQAGTVHEDRATAVTPSTSTTSPSTSASTTTASPATSRTDTRTVRRSDFHRYQPDQESVPGNAAFGRVGTP